MSRSRSDSSSTTFTGLSSYFPERRTISNDEDTTSNDEDTLSDNGAPVYSGGSKAPGAPCFLERRTISNDEDITSNDEDTFSDNGAPVYSGGSKAPGAPCFLERRTISNDEDITSNDEDTFSDNGAPVYSGGSKAPGAPCDDSPECQKASGTPFGEELPNHIVGAVIRCAEEAIQARKEKFEQRFQQQVKECYKKTFSQFEEERDGYIREMVAVISKGEISEWVRKSDWKDQDMSSPLRNITLSHYSLAAEPTSPAVKKRKHEMISV